MTYQGAGFPCPTTAGAMAARNTGATKRLHRCACCRILARMNRIQTLFRRRRSLPAWEAVGSSRMRASQQ
jgi:hypothetical protein